VRALKAALWRGSPITLAEFILETGRSHQIRVQCAHEGFPILGDRKYKREPDGFARTALHSMKVEFPHPISRERLVFEAPLPDDLRGL
jgi:23S rRNA pseudouridine1911/1915/1917 synthase